MKLEDLLGEELYAQVQAKLDEVNAKEPDKLKHVRYADLSEGEYVGKGKYESEVEKLNNLIAGKDAELTTANGLIADLKKATKGEEGLQQKISSYETEVANLQNQLAETKLQSAVKVALLSENAVDVDYLSFKLKEKMKEKNSSLELDENDNIKGWDDMLAVLKTQFPAMFESASGGERIITPNTLPNNNNEDTLTKSELLKKPYAERARIAQKNPEAYAAAMNS